VSMARRAIRVSTPNSDTSLSWLFTFCRSFDSQPTRADISKLRREHHAARQRRRNARKRVNGGSRTKEEWQALCAKYDFKCWLCGERKPLPADHVPPIAKGGMDDISNIQPLCFICNVVKGSDFIDYRLQDERFLQVVNKKEAADFLGVSERAVERYTKAGKLSTRYAKGKTRPVAVYSESELHSLKQELEHPAGIRPLVESPINEKPLALMPTNPDQTASNPDTALSRFDGAAVMASEAFMHVLAQMAAPVRVSEKFLLSLAEAAQLSGLSRGHLRQAITEKKLKARIIGRGWKIKRDDLDLYVKKL